MFNLYDVANAFAALEQGETAIFTREISVNNTKATLSVTGEGTLKAMGVFAQINFGLDEKDEKQMFYSASLQKNRFSEPPGKNPAHQFVPMPLLELAQMLGIDFQEANWEKVL